MALFRSLRGRRVAGRELPGRITRVPDGGPDTRRFRPWNAKDRRAPRTAVLRGGRATPIADRAPFPPEASAASTYIPECALLLECAGRHRSAQRPSPPGRSRRRAL